MTRRFTGPNKEQEFAAAVLAVEGGVCSPEDAAAFWGCSQRAAAHRFHKRAGIRAFALATDAEVDVDGRPQTALLLAAVEDVQSMKGLPRGYGPESRRAEFRERRRDWVKLLGPHLVRSIERAGAMDLLGDPPGRG